MRARCFLFIIFDSWLSAVLITVSSCAIYAGGPGAAPRDHAVQTQMRNLMYHFSPSISVHIKTLDGQLVPVDASGYPVFDNKDSFVVLVSSAELAVTALRTWLTFSTLTSSLAPLLRSAVFPSPLEMATST